MVVGRVLCWRFGGVGILCCYYDVRSLCRQFDGRLGPLEFGLVGVRREMWYGGVVKCRRGGGGVERLCAMCVW